MELKSLDAHNKDMSKIYVGISTYPRPNGIACPECGRELMDTNAVVLDSYPPQKNVHCSSSNCDFCGYRIA